MESSRAWSSGERPLFFFSVSASRGASFFVVSFSIESFYMMVLINSTYREYIIVMSTMQATVVLTRQGHGYILGI